MSIQKEFDDLVAYWIGKPYATMTTIYDNASDYYKIYACAQVQLVYRHVGVMPLAELISKYATEDLRGTYVGDSPYDDIYVTRMEVFSPSDKLARMPSMIVLVASDESFIVPHAPVDDRRAFIIMACVNAVCISRGLFPISCNGCGVNV